VDSEPRKDRLEFDVGWQPKPATDNPNGSGPSRNRWLILAALLALGLVSGGIAYEYFDDLSELAQFFTGGKLGRPQGRLHY
jgi:hypothetical protein